MHDKDFAFHLKGFINKSRAHLNGLQIFCGQFEYKIYKAFFHETDLKRKMKCLSVKKKRIVAGERL